MDKPLFAIISSTFNSEKTLVETLESILNQEFHFFNASYKITGDCELLLRAMEELKVGFMNTFVVDMGVERAKVETAKRNPLVCWLEMNGIFMKIKLKG